MKTIIVAIVVTGIAVCSFSKPVPEITKLDPEKYTLRLVVASGNTGIFKKSDGLAGFEWESSETNKQTQYIASTNNPAIFTPHKSPMISLIEQADPTYTEFASVHLKLGEEFSSKNALVKGLVKPSGENMPLITGVLTECELSPQANNQTVSLSVEFNYKDIPIKLNNLSLQKGKWCCLVLGDKNKNDVMLIRLYDPQN
jgi:hypothetical protein